MGKKKKNKTPAARLELDKSMRERMDKPDNAVLGMNMLSYTPPPDFSYVQLPATRLCYSPDENISIDVNAICENFGDSYLKFKWKCTELNSDDSAGKDYENTTKSPYAVISSLNNIANDHRILITASVEDAGNPVKTADAGTMIIKPVITPKEITDNVEWFSVQDGVKMKVNSELDKMVCSVIELYGYNGEEVIVDRFVTLKGDIIFSNIGKLVVSNNCLLVKFNRSEIAGKAKTGDTVTLNYAIQACTGESSDTIRHDFKLAERTLVKEEAADALQPVVCGPVDIKENNFKQCKYTKIEAEYAKDPKGTEKEKITVFQENDNIEALPINLIGGKRKVDIVLSDYTPDKCRLKEGSHKSDNKAILKGYNIKDKEPLDISGGKITREFEYDYGYSVKQLLAFPELELFKLLVKYFWPTRKGVRRQYTVSFGTCRHSHSVDINVYPDIEFEFAFIYKNSLGAEKLQNLGIATGSINPYNSPAKVLGMEVNLGYSLSLKTKFNDGIELSLSDGIKEKIETTFGILDVLKKLLDKTLGLEGKESIGDTEVSVPTSYKQAQLNPRVLTAFMKTPSAAVGIKWKANYKSPDNVGVELKMYAKIDPLLHIGLYFDVISFVGKYGGPWGKVIEGVRAFLALAFNTQIRLYIMVSGKSKIEIGGEASINKIIDAYQNEGLELGHGMAIVEMQVGLEVDVNGKFVLIQVKFKAELYGKGGLYYKLSFGADSRGLYYQQSFGNTSIVAVGKLSGGVSLRKAKRTESTDYGTVTSTQTTDMNHSVGKTFTILDKKEWGEGEKNYFN